MRSCERWRDYDPHAVARRAGALPAAPGGGRPRSPLVGGFVRDVWLGARAARARRRDRGRRRSRSPARCGGELSPCTSRSARRSASGAGLAHRRRDGAPRALPGARARCRVVEPATIEEDLAAARLHRQRDRRHARRRRCSRAAHAARGPRRARACACSTTRSFADDPTRDHAARALRRAAAASRSSRTPRRSAAAAGFETLSGARLGAELRLVARRARPGRRCSRALAGAAADRRRPRADRGRARARTARRRPRDARARRRGARGRAGSTTLELTARERAIVRAAARRARARRARRRARCGARGG